MKHADLIALCDRVGKVFESIPEDAIEGPCGAYYSSILELEDLHGGLQSERNALQRKLYRADIRRAARRARRARPRCVLHLRIFGERIASRADSLPDVPDDLS